MSGYHMQDLDTDNVQDVKDTVSTDWYGIVSERDGGIIGYAMNYEHANVITAALNASVSEFKPNGEFDYHRRQWDKIKSNRGQEGMSVIISSLSGDTNTLNISNDMARDLLARMSEADI